jgi:hypothetical protein
MKAPGGTQGNDYSGGWISDIDSDKNGTWSTDDPN